MEASVEAGTGTPHPPSQSRTAAEDSPADLDPKKEELLGDSDMRKLQDLAIELARKGIQEEICELKKLEESGDEFEITKGKKDVWQWDEWDLVGNGLACWQVLDEKQSALVRKRLAE